MIAYATDVEGDIEYWNRCPSECDYECCGWLSCAEGGQSARLFLSKSTASV